MREHLTETEDDPQKASLDAVMPGIHERLNNLNQDFNGLRGDVLACIENQDKVLQVADAANQQRTTALATLLVW